ncbi:MAG TPA: hypothetical protein VHW65_11250, partial [Gemmatimonadales bacterium]|nr:hypothetical protein [Gemmatimonadales bacterium]
MTYHLPFCAPAARAGRVNAMSVLAMSFAAPMVRAQELKPRATVTIDVQSRWLNASQPAAFTQFTNQRLQLHVDSVVLGRDDRRVWLSQNYNLGGVSTTLRGSVDASGRAAGLLVILGKAPSQSCGPPQGRGQVDRDGGSITLTEQLGGLGVFFAQSNQVSRMSRAALATTAAVGKSHSVMRGSRITRFLRDSVVRGLHLALLRDSAEITLSDNVPWDAGTPEYDRFPDSIPTVSHDVRGSITGWRLVNPQNGRTLWIADTTTLRGTATLHLADGRIFHTTTQYDQRTTAIVADSGAPPVAPLPPAQSQLAFYADTSLHRRLAAGDATATDSVLRILDHPPSPAAHEIAIRALAGFSSGRQSGAVREWILRSGDTATVFGEFMANGMSPAAYDLVHPVLADPRYAFNHGVHPETYFWWERLQLLANAPISDSTHWGCPAPLCRAIASEWPSAPEPHLRELGLVARFALDPMRWADTVIGLARSHPMLEEAARTAVGANATGGRDDMLPVPPSGASWHRWAAWLATFYPNESFAPGSYTPAVPTVAVNAVRTVERIQHRNVAAELLDQFAHADDSARFVFGTMLTALNPRYRSEQDALIAFTTGDALDQLLAYRGFSARMSATTIADSAAVREIVEHVAAMILDGAAPWPEFHNPGA